MSHSTKPTIPDPRPINPRVSIGHINLKVANPSRAIAFERGRAGVRCDAALWGWGCLPLWKWLLPHSVDGYVENTGM